MIDKEKKLINRNYSEEITKILSSDKSNLQKKELLEQYHESDIAEAIDQLDEELRKKVYNILDVDVLGEVILYSDDLDELVEEFEPETLAEMIEKMDADDAMDVLEELDEEVREEVVSLIDDEEVKENE